MYAKLARVPCLDPSDSMEAKEFIGHTLAISEQFDTSVIVKGTTRIARSKTTVDLYPRKEYPNKGLERNLMRSVHERRCTSMSSPSH
jgi:indolepyruvate ferredoxin oxidoreductase alpha subunit